MSHLYESLGYFDDFCGGFVFLVTGEVVTAACEFEESGCVSFVSAFFCSDVTGIVFSCGRRGGSATLSSHANRLQIMYKIDPKITNRLCRNFQFNSFM